jgi:hypothetical protein
MSQSAEPLAKRDAAVRSRVDTPRACRPKVKFRA